MLFLGSEVDTGRYGYHDLRMRLGRIGQGLAERALTRYQPLPLLHTFIMNLEYSTT